jgi:hypothetical protein
MSGWAISVGFEELKGTFRIARARGMSCPVCGGEANASGKEWKFGQFDAKGYKCGSFIQRM